MMCSYIYGTDSKYVLCKINRGKAIINAFATESL